MVFPSKNGGTGRPTFGSQITLAMPMSATINEIVTTIFTTSEVPSMPRMMTRSINAPNSGPITKTTRMIAGTIGTPQAMCTCQNMNAAIIEKAPWAKLKMPEVV